MKQKNNSFSLPESGTLPAAIPGFDHINRYWDSKHDIFAAKILPGEYYVSLNGELITTVLGSCVSACVRDTRRGIGGMNHFMLPESTSVNQSSNIWKATPVSIETRYGNIAMERLINVILAGGGDRRNLEIKLFGGGRVLDISNNIGGKNIEFVRHYLSVEGLAVIAEDVGDVHPRKIEYFPQTGRARVKKLTSLHNDTLIKREKEYSYSLKHKPIEGKIDLFE